MIDTKDLPKYQLARLSGWDIAKRFGIQYTGDMSPIPHGGTWYKLPERNEEYEDDYFTAARIDDVDGVLCVEGLTCNLPNNFNDLFAALRTIGMEPDLCICGVEPGALGRECMVAEALLSYHCEVDESVFVQTEDDGPVDSPGLEAQRMTENQCLNLAMHFLGIHDIARRERQKNGRAARAAAERDRPVRTLDEVAETIAAIVEEGLPAAEETERALTEAIEETGASPAWIADKLVFGYVG